MNLRRAALAFLLAAFVAGAAPAFAEVDYTKLPGYVDKDSLVDEVGEDDVKIEIWLPGSLLRIVKGVDPELGELVDGLELAQALVVETDDEAKTAELLKRFQATESGLLKRGWVRLAKIQDGGENVRVLILTKEETIRGLVVMVGDRAAGEFVFANVAGVIDLAAIQRLGRRMEIPGLNNLEVKP